MPDPAHLRRAKRERACVDAEDGVGEPSREAQQPAGVPVRVPQRYGTPRSLGERPERARRRAEPCARARIVRPLAQLARERAHERQTTSEPRRARRRRAHARSRQWRMDAHGLTEHHDLVAARRQRFDEVECLRERGMLSVERLRDEDEPHQRDRAIHELAVGSGELSRRRVPVLVPLVSRRAELRRQVRGPAGRAEAPRRAHPHQLGVSGSPRPICHEIGDPARIGRDHPAAAGKRLDYDSAEALGPGWQDEQSCAVDALARRRRARARRWCSTLLRAIRERAARSSAAAALADDHEPSFRDLARDTAPSGGQALDVLVPPRARRRRVQSAVAAAALTGVRGERRKVAVGREDRRRPALPAPPRRDPR